ncbi:glycosyltransferase [Bacillus mangrovi]|uniref:Glycosyltransferase n=2 Tax=Metabacillus mangrovi TaxID=1491830 RepID=A0A7X2S1H2_9BACI|nr:glycosyltransferase [Metabacillus mangrovi]
MISVIMPVFNAARFLKPCIESILCQTEKDFELLIINDGSTDESESVIQTFGDPRIKYVTQANAGVSKTRNKALDLAEGYFIVFQDADDVSVPSRFQQLRQQFHSETVGLVHSDVLLIDEQDQPAGYYSNRNLDKQRALRYFFKIGTPICGGTVMARKECFENVRYDVELKIGEDNEILSRITQKWDSVHVPEPLYLYRRHSHNSARHNQYATVFAHVQKFLDDYPLEVLIPELDWSKNSSKSRAYAIISLFLHGRGMHLHADNWMKTAEEYVSDQDSSLFVKAISMMLASKYKEGLQLLDQCSIRDHITENYKGECLARLQDAPSALQCFFKSLKLAPHYQEPMDNLKALGGMGNFMIGDITWQKYH